MKWSLLRKRRLHWTVPCVRPIKSTTKRPTWKIPMIIQKAKLHNELKIVRVTKCDAFSPFCIIFRQFCSGDTIVRRTFIAALFGGTFGLMLHTCLMIPTNNNFSLSALCSEYAIANIFVDLSMIFVSVFFFLSVFCLVFVLFWILDIYVYFSLCICCAWWAPFNVFFSCSPCLGRCVRMVFHILMVFLEMSITPLITIDLVVAK